MNFNKLCRNSEIFLKKYKNNIFMYAISSAHILKNHPEFKNILKKKNNKVKIIQYLKNLIIENLILKFSNKKFIKTDVLIISNLLNENKVNDIEDPYFGNIHLFLKSIKISTFFVLRNFTKINHHTLSNNMASKRKYILPKTTFIGFEIILIFLFLKNYLWENFKLIFCNKENYSVLKNFLKFNSMKTSIANLRISYQILEICKNTKPKIIIYTYEGHAWEKILIWQIKKYFKNNIIFIGYQFSTLTQNSYSIFKKRKKLFMPNYILTSGSISRKILIKHNILNRKNIITLGTNKNINNPKIISKKKNILILPEGFISETALLIKFVNSLADYNKNYNFILRLHPLVDRNYIKSMFKFKKNFSLSHNKYLRDDIKICNYVFYRGTSAVFECIFSHIHPIYICNKKALVDPLYFISKRSILTTDKTNTCLNNFLKKEKTKFDNVYKLANKFYSKIDYKNLKNIINLHV